MKKNIFVCSECGQLKAEEPTKTIKKNNKVYELCALCSSKLNKK